MRKFLLFTFFIVVTFNVFCQKATDSINQNQEEIVRELNDKLEQNEKDIKTLYRRIKRYKEWQGDVEVRQSWYLTEIVIVLTFVTLLVAVAAIIINRQEKKRYEEAKNHVDQAIEANQTDLIQKLTDFNEKKAEISATINKKFDEVDKLSSTLKDENKLINDKMNKYIEHINKNSHQIENIEQGLNTAFANLYAVAAPIYESNGKYEMLIHSYFMIIYFNFAADDYIMAEKHISKLVQVIEDYTDDLKLSDKEHEEFWNEKLRRMAKWQIDDEKMSKSMNDSIVLLKDNITEIRDVKKHEDEIEFYTPYFDLARIGIDKMHEGEIKTLRQIVRDENWNLSPVEARVLGRMFYSAVLRGDFSLKPTEKNSANAQLYMKI